MAARGRESRWSRLGAGRLEDAQYGLLAVDYILLIGWTVGSYGTSVDRMFR